MPYLVLVFLALAITLVTTPVHGFECANVGTAPTVAPDDNGDATAIACGPSALADGAGGVALGSFSDANGDESSAMGYSARSLGAKSLAVGWGAYSEGENSTALGNSTQSSGNSSTAVGHQATSVGEASTALGAEASSAGLSSTALGNLASSAGLNGTALGAFATSTGINSTASGAFASSVGDFSTALGSDASSVGLGSAALGYLASSDGIYSTALGASTSSAGNYSTALGIGTSSAGNRSAALGYAASSGGKDSTALGFSAVSQGEGGTALGFSAVSVGDYSTAVGFGAYSQTPYSVVLGAIAGVNLATQNSNVGIGTTSPIAPLHIYRDDATQEMIILDSNGAGGAQDRAMIQLVNNGGIRFQFDNLELMTSWRFQAATGDQDNFEITKVGTGEIEFRVDANGNAYVANDLEVGGTVTTNLNIPSDISLKQNIKSINPDDLLQKVAALPVQAWEYSNKPGQRHIGPIAQDFRAAFGLGADDKSISVVDASGVALASIQALEARNRKLEVRNIVQDAELKSLRQEMQELKFMLLQMNETFSQN